MNAKRNCLLAALGAIGLVVAGCQSAPVTPSTEKVAIKEAVKTGGEASRRTVKTGMDPDASKVDLSPKATSIEDINKLHPTGKLAGRVGPFETSTWQVKASLQSIKLMKDGDYYLVMKGDKGGQAVVEVPDPKDCKGSPFHDQIAVARKALEERYHPTTDLKKIDDGATVTGVGFLGFGDGKKKSTKAQTGARLMPGLDFKFDKKG